MWINVTIINTSVLQIRRVLKTGAWNLLLSLLRKLIVTEMPGSHQNVSS